MGRGGKLFFSGIANLLLNASSGRDRINVQSTVVGTTTNINSGAANDTIVVSSSGVLDVFNNPVGGTIDGIRGTLNIDGGSEEPAAVNAFVNAYAVSRTTGRCGP